jgi:thiol:disulfide interchange protein
MGFLLLGTVLFLLNTLREQLGEAGLFWTTAFLFCVSLATWFYGKAEYGLSAPRQLVYYALALIALVSGWLVCYRGENSVKALLAQRIEARRAAALAANINDLDWSKPDVPWVPYSREKALDTARRGYTLFIDYTASWCMNCKTNEKLIINTPMVRKEMQRLGIIPFQADYSLYDPEIKKDLDEYQRSGVPMYIVIPAGQPDKALILDEVLTYDQLIAAFQKAGPSHEAAGLAMK